MSRFSALGIRAASFLKRSRKRPPFAGWSKSRENVVSVIKARHEVAFGSIKDAKGYNAENQDTPTIQSKNTLLYYLS